MRPEFPISGLSSRSDFQTSRQRVIDGQWRRYSLLNRFLLWLSLWYLWLLRVFISSDHRSYAFLNVGTLQPFLARVGLMRARAVFLKAGARCPAYRAFLEAEGYRASRPWRLMQ